MEDSTQLGSGFQIFTLIGLIVGSLAFLPRGVGFECKDEGYIENGQREFFLRGGGGEGEEREKG